MRATDLHVGDVIVDEDGSEHTITALQLTHATVKWVTDTGRAVSLNWHEAEGLTLRVRI
jgi:hypothetical protein